MDHRDAVIARGFSLLEATIAMAILAVAVAMFSQYMVTTNQIVIEQFNDAANQISLRNGHNAVVTEVQDTKIERVSPDGRWIIFRMPDRGENGNAKTTEDGGASFGALPQMGGWSQLMLPDPQPDNNKAVKFLYTRGTEFDFGDYYCRFIPYGPTNPGEYSIVKEMASASPPPGTLCLGRDIDGDGSLGSSFDYGVVEMGYFKRIMPSVAPIVPPGGHPTNDWRVLAPHVLMKQGGDPEHRIFSWLEPFTDTNGDGMNNDNGFNAAGVDGKGRPNDRNANGRWDPVLTIRLMTMNPTIDPKQSAVEPVSVSKNSIRMYNQ